MTALIPAPTISPLRQRLIDDMNMRRFSPETQRNYIRDVGRFATFLGRRPDIDRANALSRAQAAQASAGEGIDRLALARHPADSPTRHDCSANFARLDALLAEQVLGSGDR